MPTRIRLQRKGKKKFAYYHIVIADSRAPRDGRFIEKVGIYNPNTNPATIELDFEKTLSWLQKGAQPSDTCKAILSYKGVMFKNHMLNGVKKGALTPELAEAKFDTWLKEKNAKIEAKKERVMKEKDGTVKKRLAAESKTREVKAEAVAKKFAKLAAAEAAPVENTEEQAPAEPETPQN